MEKPYSTDNKEASYLELNGLRFHVLLDGPENGKLLVFLHGFPEFSYGWRHQLAYFASKGYRVVAPDQRGYNLSDKPKSVTDYNLDILVSDVVALIRFFKRDKAVVIGHDWGGIVAWRLAQSHPELLEKLVILNVPHPAVFKSFIRKSWSQKKRSWYILLFQIPFLSEALYRLLGEKSMRESSRPGTFTQEDFKIYRMGWNQGGSLKAMMQWYRAALRCPPRELLDESIFPSTLILWGKKDHFLMFEMAELSLHFCKKGRLIFLDEATHWLQHEFPEKVNESIDGFIVESD